MSRTYLVFFLVLLAVILVGMAGLITFFRGRDTANTQLAVDEQVQTTCSDACVDHGQCGTIGDNRVVLAMDGGPAVTLHDRFFPEGAIVRIVELSQRDLVAARNGVPLSTADATPFPHTFYRVSGELGKTAWVSAWCLARP